ncbi:TonB-dependent receptor [Pseudomaricurvus alkylphenolicus]|uniref:TonB-dependent receptor n=1 Tax=Pseudomaricurvus alkylphenolicus TaxID=1306991 RepID=UPI00141DD610|nr:TonB-dependent receptor [Pseudomaricurvus alkylphenolicus]NIB37966.1 TonB-dependent receptor [Pseudomaricurvus alkylphenolicus]
MLPKRKSFERSTLTAAVIAASASWYIPASAETFELEEIIVTAARRAQSVEEIPYNISAVSGNAIADAGISDLQSLTRMIPGLTSADTGVRGGGVNSNLIIRGLNTGSASNNTLQPNISVPLVSTYVDETPLFVNLKINDIERVEVLRGPQGTLYGSGSMGGTLRLIHRKPDTQAFSADISGKLSFTDDSSEETYSTDGVFNFPLSDTMALRVGLGYEEIGGFVDANARAVFGSDGQPLLADPSDPLNSGLVFTEQEDVDSADVKYFRASLLWDVSDTVEAQLTYHRQEESSDDFSVQRIGDENENSIPLGAPMDREVDLYALDISADVGFATFSSSTSFYDNQASSASDGTGFMENISNSDPFIYGGFPRVLSTLEAEYRDQSFAQEFRLVSNGDGKIDWVVGAFYRDQRIDITTDPQFLHGFDQWSELSGSGHLVSDIIGIPGLFDTFADFVEANGALRPSQTALTDHVFNFDRDYSFEDLAVFGELTYHVTDAWQVTVGMRQFWQEFEQELLQQLPVCGPYCSPTGTDPNGSLTSQSKEEFQDNIFKINTSYDLDNDTMVYFTWAEGFRHGGANGLAMGNCALCETDEGLLVFDSDTATNTEIGIKGTLWDNTNYTLSVFHIDWQDVQLEAFTDPASLPFVFNGESARSQGLELEINSQLTESITATLGYGYVDAELTDDFIVESVVGEDGSKLPGVPKHQLSLSMDYFKPLDNGAEMHLHVDGFYRDQVTSTISDKFYDSFSGTVVNDADRAGFRELDAFSIWNASANISKDQWRAGIFVTNLTNEEGVTGIVTNESSAYNREFVTRPRTIGVSVGYRWD